MLRSVLFGLVALVLSAHAGVPAVAAEKAAKVLFGSVTGPANLKPRAYGTYTRGCLAGGKELKPDGKYHQAMRLSRNRNWGHPAMVDVVMNVAKTVAKQSDWPGILVGDLAQPRGGPMLSGHASHQLGLDADVWLNPMPEKRYSKSQREKISAKSMLVSIKAKPKNLKVNRKIWGKGQLVAIRAAAKDKRVARIFVNPAIKRALCKDAGKDRSWLRKVRAWYGHHYHFHIRINCPPGSTKCKNQNAPPAGAGCGKALAWWFTDAPYRKRKPRKKPMKLAPPLKMTALPRVCRTVLKAK